MFAGYDRETGKPIREGEIVDDDTYDNIEPPEGHYVRRCPSCKKVTYVPIDIIDELGDRSAGEFKFERILSHCPEHRKALADKIDTVYSLLGYALDHGIITLDEVGRLGFDEKEAQAYRSR